MDLTSYNGLCAAIADFLNRTNLSSQIPGFITLTESKIKRRVRRKTVRAQFDIDSEETKLPPDCSSLRSIYPLTVTPNRDQPFRIGTPELVAETRQRHNGVPGCPVWGCVVDGSLIVAPEPDTFYTYQITYYKKLTPLSATNPTNDVLAEAPDIYLYGGLMEAAPYLQHDERIPVWKAAFDAAIDELDATRAQEEFGASLRPVRIRAIG